MGLSTSIERRQRSQEKIIKILKIKRQFQERYEALCERVTKNRNQQLQQMAIVILKAYATK